MTSDNNDRRRGQGKKGKNKMTSNNNDRSRGQGKQGKNKVKNHDDTPTPSPPTTIHVFRPQHPHFPSSSHTTMSPQYAHGIPSSAHVFSSMPSQGDSLMPPPGYGPCLPLLQHLHLHRVDFHQRRSLNRYHQIFQDITFEIVVALSPSLPVLRLRWRGGILPSWFLVQIERSVIGLLSNLQGLAIQNLYDLPYPTWSDFPYDLRQTMFNQFKKKYVWLPEYDKQIAKNFEKKASARLSEMFSAARKLKKKPSWVGDNAYTELLKYWKSPKFMEKSAQAKKARASEKGGSVYCGGAKPQSAWKKELEANTVESCLLASYSKRLILRKGNPERARVNQFGVSLGLVLPMKLIAEEWMSTSRLRAAMNRVSHTNQLMKKN